MTTVYGINAEHLNADSDQWAYRWLRLSFLVALKDDDELKSAMRGFYDDGSLNKMLDGLLEAQEHFQRYAEMMALVLGRTSYALESIGCHAEQKSE
jgi:hypothetical protein